MQLIADLSKRRGSNHRALQTWKTSARKSDGNMRLVNEATGSSHHVVTDVAQSVRPGAGFQLEALR
jgi:hypothetical protein